MKLFNIFKKETKNTAKSNIQKMDKNQLSKVIGGGDDKLTATISERAVSTQGVK